MSNAFEILFTVKEQHLKLLKRLVIGYDADTEFGAPEVDPKRPYGNSDVYTDIGEILGIKPDAGDSDDPEWSTPMKERFDELHGDMENVLQILVQNNGVQLGEYKADEYSRKWSKA